MDFSRSDPRKLEIVYIVDFSCVGKDGRNIRGDVAFALSRSYYDGSILSRNIDLIGIVFEHHAKSICPPHSDKSPVYRVYGPHLVFSVIIIYELDHHFAVGPAVKAVAVLLELFGKLLIIFNNAVVYSDNLGFHLP